MRWLTGLLASATAAAVVIVTVCAVAASVGGTATPRPASARTHAIHMTPVYGDPGSTITVLGHGFSARTVVYVGGKPAPTTLVSHAELTFVVPPSKYAQTDVALHTGKNVFWLGLFTYGPISSVPPMSDTVLPSASASASPATAVVSRPMVAAELCTGIRDQSDAEARRGAAVAYATIVVGPSDADVRHPAGNPGIDIDRLPVAHVWLLAGKLTNGPVTYLTERVHSGALPYTPPGTYSVLLKEGDEPGVYEPVYGVAGTFSQALDPWGRYELVERCQPQPFEPSVVGLASPLGYGTNPGQLLSLFRAALRPATAETSHSKRQPSQQQR